MKKTLLATDSSRKWGLGGEEPNSGVTGDPKRHLSCGGRLHIRVSHYYTFVCVCVLIKSNDYTALAQAEWQAKLSPACLQVQPEVSEEIFLRAVSSFDFFGLALVMVVCPMEDPVMQTPE